jgi:DNA (cytosine-5)-methyltransferase 1
VDGSRLLYYNFSGVDVEIMKYLKKENYYELALFAGAGGGILGGKLCGFTCVGAVEIEEYPREVLKQRQRDGLLPEFPIWDDVTTFRLDNSECSEYIEILKSVRERLVITGGFPCQDISSAGKGAGIKQGTRSGLWFEMARIINEIRPARVLVENSPILTSRGLGIVLGDLAEMGYNAKWGVLGAVDVGAPHKRERIWIVADSKCLRWNQRTCKGVDKRRKPAVYEESSNNSSKRPKRDYMADAEKLQSDVSNIDEKDGEPSTQKFRGSNSEGKVCNAPIKRLQDRKQKEVGQSGEIEKFERPSWWSTEPELGRVANGVARRVDRLKAIGNGQVPAVVKAAWNILK